MSLETLGPLVGKSMIFQGPESNPFLAPRGVYVNNNQLFVSDTGRNRVFIWNQLPEALHQEPDVILGQPDLGEAGRNSGKDVSAGSLQYPSGVWSDGSKLIVADAWNHRVLIWHAMPEEHGQPADVVIGQPDFESNEPNISGIGKGPSAKSLYWPYGVFSDGRKLWIADTGNRRILFYNELPQQSYAAADGIIGKPDYSTRDYENQDPIWPYSVKVGKRGEISVADTQFYRNLLWNDAGEASNSPADVIIGQANFDACGQNQFGLFPSERSLNWTYDSCFYKDGVLIADTGNSRILWFDGLPEENNAEASGVIGKPDFKTGSENKDTIIGTSSSLYWPFSIAVHNEMLVIADTGNHRLVFAELLI